MTSLIPRSFFEVDDIFFKDLFNTNSLFKSVYDTKVNYPVDVKNTKEGVEIDVAAIGLDKKDIDIDINSNVLTISYQKDELKKEKDVEYIHNGISRRSFNLAWRISDKCDLSKTTASLDKGLLKVKIPYASEKQNKQLTVKID